LTSSSAIAPGRTDPALETFLVGDVGGTNCRLSLARASGGRLRLDQPQGYKCADFADARTVIDHYLRSVGWSAPLEAAVIAVAGPVDDGVVQSTNMRWRMSEAQLRGQGARKVKLVNDFTALALSVDQLGEDDVIPLGSPAPGRSQDTVAVIGAGTGFGVGAVARGIGGDAVIATEGGHISFAPVDEVEVEILRILTARYGRVSIERLLSGPGLVNLRAALAQIAGVALDPIASEDIVRAAEEGDSLSEQALERFCAIYGSVAGDIALVYGARGGVFLGGGIAPAIAQRLQASAFRARFEAKGRFRAYLSAIPTCVIANPHAALLGAASLASAM
jgi:glucokinase